MIGSEDYGQVDVSPTIFGSTNSVVFNESPNKRDAVFNVSLNEQRENNEGPNKCNRDNDFNSPNMDNYALGRSTKGDVTSPSGLIKYRPTSINARVDNIIDAAGNDGPQDSPSGHNNEGIATSPSQNNPNRHGPSGPNIRYISAGPIGQTSLLAYITALEVTSTHPETIKPSYMLPLQQN